MPMEQLGALVAVSLGVVPVTPLAVGAVGEAEALGLEAPPW